MVVSAWNFTQMLVTEMWSDSSLKIDTTVYQGAPAAVQIQAPLSALMLSFRFQKFFENVAHRQASILSSFEQNSFNRFREP